MISIRAAGLGDIPFIMELERECATAAHWSEEQYRHAIQCPEGGVERMAITAEAPRVKIAGCEVTPPTLSPETRQGWGTLSDWTRSVAELRPCALDGFLVARRVSEEWELENIVVAPGFRRQGIGMQLIDALFARVQAMKGRAVFLEVRESNAAARTLYERAGFQESGRRMHYYSGPAEDAVVYCKNVV
jgi:ribosomal-protein-alanine acetyltransferase